MDVTYPNIILEPSPLEYWLILLCIAFASLIIVPCGCLGLRYAVKQGEHPGHVALRKTLVFEGVSFTLCFVFYVISIVSTSVNYQFNSMMVFAFYCALHITQLALHNALTLRNEAQLRAHHHVGMSKCPLVTFSVLLGGILIIALIITL